MSSVYVLREKLSRQAGRENYLVESPLQAQQWKRPSERAANTKLGIAVFSLHPIYIPTLIVI
jgi:hypothetical protein